MKVGPNEVYYQDELNVKFNKPIGSRWFTEKPDDGGTYFFIRSHLLSHHNNAEEYSDNFEIISKRCQFWKDDTGEIQDNTITFGYTEFNPQPSATYDDYWHRKAIDLMDNYTYKKFKDWKPGDIIQIEGATSDDNNGTFRITDYDWHDKALYEQASSGTQTSVNNPEYNYGYGVSDQYPSLDEDKVVPRLSFRIAALRLDDDDDDGSRPFGAWKPHRLATERFYAQIFQDDISTNTQGSGYSTTDGYRPLDFTNSINNDDLGDLCNIEGFIYIGEDSGGTHGYPIGGDVIITKPGHTGPPADGFTAMSSYQASRLAITIRGSNSNSVSIESTELSEVPNDFDEDTSSNTPVGSYTTGDWTRCITDDDHGFIENQRVTITNSSSSTLDGSYEIVNVKRYTDPGGITANDIYSFDIENTWSGSTETGDAAMSGAGNSPTVAHVFDHTAQKNLIIGNWITITNLSRKYQDSSNSKIFDRSIPNMRVDNPPGRAEYDATGIDTHANPINGRWGNTGRVSTRNHGHNDWNRKSNSDYPGPGYVSGDRANHYKEMFEYEGRWANQHKLETFHNPVPFPPEIYGNIQIGFYSQNVSQPMIWANDKWNINSSYMPIFGDGTRGEDAGGGNKLYPSTQGLLYCVSNTTKSAPQMLVEVPIKGYLRSMRDEGLVKDWEITQDMLYDVNVEVFWQPFGESKEVKLGLAGTSTVEGI